jgi:hypothetical protein
MKPLVVAVGILMHKAGRIFLFHVGKVHRSPTSTDERVLNFQPSTNNLRERNSTILFLIKSPQGEWSLQARRLWIGRNLIIWQQGTIKGADNLIFNFIGIFRRLAKTATLDTEQSDVDRSKDGKILLI